MAGTRRDSSVNAQTWSDLMASITCRVDPQLDLAVFAIEGEMTSEDLVDAVRRFYAQGPTRLILWDMTRGTGRGISTEDYARLARTLKRPAARRPDGRTALVTVHEVDFGLARMFESLALEAGVQVAYRTFRTVAEARRWLGLPD